MTGARRRGAAPVPEPYAPRRRARLDDARLGGIACRFHWIDALGEAAPPPGLLRAALGHAAAVLPAAAEAEGGAEGLGFLVLHRGAAGTWLLMHWWAHGDILCGRLARAEPGAASFAPCDGRPLVACVWELAVLGEERDAWVRTMMTAAPSPDAWRAA